MVKEYFSHDYDASNDLKLAAMVGEFEAAGYGIFWRTVEMLHKEGGFLPFSVITFSAIARSLKTEIELVERVITASIDVYDLFKKKGKNFISNRALKNLEKREMVKSAKSEAGKASARKRKDSKKADISSTEFNGSSTPVEQNSTKEKKEEEKKEEEIIENGGEKNSDGKPNDEPDEKNLLSGNFVIPEMVRTFKNHQPKYQIFQENDFPAAREIAYKIAAEKGWSKDDAFTVHREALLKRWGELCGFIVTDKWFSTRPLFDLNREWQRLILAANKANTDTKTINNDEYRKQRQKQQQAAAKLLRS